MKKLFALLLALLFVLPLLSSFSGCESQKSAAVDTNKDEGSRTEQPELTKEATETPTEAPTEQSTEAPTEPAETPAPQPTTRPTEPEHASEETLALAESTLDYMVETKQYFWLCDFCANAYANYRCDPKIAALEEPADNALALVEKYESYIDFYDSADIALFYEIFHNDANDPYFEPTEDYLNWRDMEDRLRIVEILLSMDVYFNKLNAGQRDRFYQALVHIWNILFAAQTAAYGEGKAMKLSYYDMSRREQDLSWVPIVRRAE